MYIHTSNKKLGGRRSGEEGLVVQGDRTPYAIKSCVVTGEGDDDDGGRDGVGWGLTTATFLFSFLYFSTIFSTSIFRCSSM